MKRLKLIGKVGQRTKNLIKYHGREGYPIIHSTKTPALVAYGKEPRRYITVRKVGESIKRLYEDSKYSED
jgi:hypothetical protein